MTIYFQELESVADFADLPWWDSERHALLWKLTDFFLASAEHCEEGNRNFFGELLEKLAYSLERPVREQLACRIAAEQLMPRRLILRLANDNIPLAHPVLEQSPVLTDTDLIEISRNRRQAQMLAISHRREISHRVSAAFAERGNEDVMHSLLQKPGAQPRLRTHRCGVRPARGHPPGGAVGCPEARVAEGARGRPRQALECRRVLSRPGCFGNRIRYQSQ